MTVLDSLCVCVCERKCGDASLGGNGELGDSDKSGEVNTGLGGITADKVVTLEVEFISTIVSASNPRPSHTRQLRAFMRSWTGLGKRAHHSHPKSQADERRGTLPFKLPTAPLASRCGTKARALTTGP
jgi:hypothetical protein